MFAEYDLKTVSLSDLKEAASTLEVAAYGKKANIAARIASHERGEGVLKKLIAKSEKTSNGDGPNAATVVKKEKDGFTEFHDDGAAPDASERARLVNSGTDYNYAKKAEEELERLCAMLKDTSQLVTTITMLQTPYSSSVIDPVDDPVLTLRGYSVPQKVLVSPKQTGPTVHEQLEAARKSIFDKAHNNDKQALFEESIKNDECTICMEEGKYLFMPCGHFGVCATCSLLFNTGAICPMCRQPVYGFA